MKKLIVTAILGLAVVSTWAQGTVDFRNGGITFRTVADRNVYDADGTTLLKGNNWVAQLYYLSGPDRGPDIATALVVTNLAVPFRSTTSTGVGGVWVTLTPIRILDNVAIGATATLQVRVWDVTKFSTFAAAIAGGGLYGQSAPFNYTVPAPGSPPDAYYMDALRSFHLVPEPSAIALGVLAVGSLLLFRRRK